MKSKYRDLLNDLVEMQTSPVYAVRRRVLERAEMAIFSQEKHLETLETLLNDLLNNSTVHYSAIEINTHNRVGFDAEKWEAEVMALLGRTEKGANA